MSNANMQSGAGRSPTADGDQKSSGRGRWLIIAGLVVFSAVTMALVWPGYVENRYREQVRQALDSQDYARAIPYMQYIIDKHPGALGMMNRLGLCFIETGQPEEALEIYQRSIKIKPDQNLKAQLGRVHMMLGDHPVALNMLKEALDADPLDPYANYYIGLYYFENGDRAKASFFFNAASANNILALKVKPLIATIRDELLPGRASDAN